MFEKEGGVRGALVEVGAMKDGAAGRGDVVKVGLWEQQWMFTNTS